MSVCVCKEKDDISYNHTRYMYVCIEYAWYTCVCMYGVRIYLVQQPPTIAKCSMPSYILYSVPNYYISLNHTDIAVCSFIIAPSVL